MKEKENKKESEEMIEKEKEKNEKFAREDCELGKKKRLNEQREKKAKREQEI